MSPSCQSALLFAALLAATAAHAQTPAARVDKLMSELTLDEKLDLLGGTGYATRAIPRLGIPAFKTSDGPVGVRSPAPSTAYAGGIGLAASWNPQLAKALGEQLGRDARSRGASFLLGPGVNIYRAPLNGRNFEYFGEDPFLGARIAVGYVEGVQSQNVSATIKHFVGNNSEFARETADSTIDERTLREIYLPIFESAVKEARVGSVMSGYNITNGSYMTANAHLADQVLKREWGFDGVYMSDWTATHDTIAAANARLDLEMPTGRYLNRATLGPALRDGTVTQATIDDKVRRLLGLGARFGWLDGVDPDVSISRYSQSAKRVALRSALEAMVLLRNEKDLLPLDAARVKTVAVIGPLAHPAVASAGGSGHVPTFTAVSLLQGISDRLGESATVTYARGVPTLRVLGLMTLFNTAAADGEPGIRAETFADNRFSGAPLATRIERQFSSGAPGFAGDPEFFSIVDSLPSAQSRVFTDALRQASPKTFERWTGWYTPEATGTHTLFVQNSAGYRLFIDGKVILDSSQVPKAALRQAKVSLDAKPHEVVFEQTTSAVFGRPFWRVGFLRDGAAVEPLAKQIAQRADVVVLAVGFDSDSELESADREFALPPGQDELIREIAAVNPNTVVVVTSGGSVDTAPWLGNIGALVAGWYPGQEGGTAFARLLFGDANFSGRLPISWDADLAANPSFPHYYYNDPSHPKRIVYREGVFVGYRGYQRAKSKPLYPFGFGLSYTTFRYGNVKVEPTRAVKPLYTVSFDVTNTGKRAGAEVAQVYVGAIAPRVPRPPRELKGFARVELAPGETQRVSVPLDSRAFAYFDVAARNWRADAGSYAIEVARSSEAVETRVQVQLPRTLRIPVSE